jgi:BlaI family penicillinase repressor
MPRNPPPLSRAEWTLMNICWRLGKSTARRIHEESLKSHRRQYQTVKTLLDRMADKGYLRVDKVGPVCQFVPTVKRSAAVSAAIEDFVGTVLDDALAPLFVHLAEGREMSEEEIETLRRLLEERKRDR